MQHLRNKTLQSKQRKSAFINEMELFQHEQHSMSLISLYDFVE